MHIYFSGVGGAGIGPLALIAHQAGFRVTGSDQKNSSYIEYLIQNGVSDIHIGQDHQSIAAVHQRQKIDWFVYSSALDKEHPNHPELQFVREYGIKHTKRDQFLAYLLRKTKQKLIAVAGTHGKTTTTGMFIWLFKELGQPLSYSVGAKSSFADIGQWQANSDYFVYEADEYDRNFLSFSPRIAVIPGIGYDHADIYPTKDDYYEAFLQFFDQSEQIVLWEEDAKKLQVDFNSPKLTVISEDSALDDIKLIGRVNRRDALAVAIATEKLGLCSNNQALAILNNFPGMSRRLERIDLNLYSDYAHTPEKIAGAVQAAQEFLNSGQKLAVVYEGLHNTRQHFIREELVELFDGAQELIVVPSYKARENPDLEDLTPEKLIRIIQKPENRKAAYLNASLKQAILELQKNNYLILALSAGGAGSLDEWLRREFLDQN